MLIPTPSRSHNPTVLGDLAKSQDALGHHNDAAMTYLCSAILRRMLPRRLFTVQLA
jgi:hypothetical protein